jgi:phosphate transport system substrate-binding protein
MSGLVTKSSQFRHRIVKVRAQNILGVIIPPAMSWNKGFWRFLLIVCVSLVHFASGAGVITIKGSDTLVILAQKWAEVYMSSHPSVKIQVTGGGSGIGFAALQNNTTDIADASRPIKPMERAACIKNSGRNPREYKVALDGLCIYVNGSNPINELSLDQLKKIFTGKITNWKDVGGADVPITTYSRENSSGTYEFFKEHVLAGQDFTARTQTMQGTAALLQSVSRDPNAIGYGGAAYGHVAKALKVKKGAGSPAIEPSEVNVVNGQYPIWRYLYNYLNPEKDKGEIADYLNWIRSPTGQKIVKEVGYYPLPSSVTP